MSSIITSMFSSPKGPAIASEVIEAGTKRIRVERSPQGPPQMGEELTLKDLMEAINNINNTLAQLPAMVRTECANFMAEHRDDLITAATPTITKNVLEAVQPMIDAQIASNQATVEETMRARDELLFNKLAALESQNDALEKTIKSPNALHFGVEESIGEAQLTEVKHLFGAVRIEETRRLGKFDPKAKRPRPVLIRYVSIADKHAAFKKSKVLRQNFKITMDDDLTTKQRAGRAALLPNALALRNEGWTTFWRGDNLFKVKGQGPPIKVIPGQQASTSSSAPMNIA
eukprot:jgi/Botrbrau1/13116/Bobra.0187s0073.1